MIFVGVRKRRLIQRSFLYYCKVCTMSDLQEMLIYSTEPYLIKRNQFFKELIHPKLKKKSLLKLEFIKALSN